MSINPQLWGWSTSPLMIHVWGWEDAETLANIITGIPRFVHGQPVWKTVLNAPSIAKVIHGAFISKAVKDSFVPKVVTDEIAFKFVHQSSPASKIAPISSPSKVDMSRPTGKVVREDRPIQRVNIPTSAPAKAVHGGGTGKIVK